MVSYKEYMLAKSSLGVQMGRWYVQQNPSPFQSPEHCDYRFKN